jgi:hypothetical protein
MALEVDLDHTTFSSVPFHVTGPWDAPASWVLKQCVSLVHVEGATLGIMTKCPPKPELPLTPNCRFVLHGHPSSPRTCLMLDGRR